jgi:uncharacterized coiled-coil DUF342 family protein
MTDNEWILWFGLILFAFLILGRLGSISRTLRSALRPSPEFDQPGYLFQDVREIKEKIDRINRTLGSLEERYIVIRENMREVSLAIEEMRQVMQSDVKDLHLMLSRIESLLAVIEQRMNSENQVFTWKPGW